MGNDDGQKKLNQQGEETTVITADGPQGRRSAKWFSYDLPVQGSGPFALVATYQTDNRRPRSFEILVDGQKVGEQTIAQGVNPGSST